MAALAAALKRAQTKVTKRRSKARLERFEREALVNLDALLKAAKNIVRSHQDAEDIVQETFLRAWKYFDSFDSGTNCRAWLFRIMFNVINTKKNKGARMTEVALEENSNHQGSNVVVFDPLKWIKGQEVLEAASKLSEEHRSVLWLVVVEEFSYREAAEILEIPIGTVMSRLHRARRELKTRLLAGDAEKKA
jgi:RNA polymerase sigma-70 factor (ECF subfamily)